MQTRKFVPLIKTILKTYTMLLYFKSPCSKAVITIPYGKVYICTNYVCKYVELLSRQTTKHVQKMLRFSFLHPRTKQARIYIPNLSWLCDNRESRFSFQSDKVCLPYVFSWGIYEYKTVYFTEWHRNNYLWSTTWFSRVLSKKEQNTSYGARRKIFKELSVWKLLEWGSIVPVSSTASSQLSESCFFMSVQKKM